MRELRRYSQKFRDAAETPVAVCPTICVVSTKPNTRWIFQNVGSTGSREWVSMKTAGGLVRAVRIIHQKGNNVIKIRTIIMIHEAIVPPVMRSPAGRPDLLCADSLLIMVVIS